MSPNQLTYKKHNTVSQYTTIKPFCSFFNVMLTLNIQNIHPDCLFRMMIILLVLPPTAKTKTAKT